jgi:hypothetical protein
MLICLRVYVEWPKTKMGWNLKNNGFYICTSWTTCWTGWNDFVVAIASFTIEITGLVDITS